MWWHAEDTLQVDALLTPQPDWQARIEGRISLLKRGFELVGCRQQRQCGHRALGRLETARPHFRQITDEWPRATGLTSFANAAIGVLRTYVKCRSECTHGRPP